MSLKRVLALVLALTMIFSLAMPGSWAFAEDDGIIAVEDEYNEEGIVEESEEEAPAITEETPAEEPAAEEIVAEQPAEEAGEPAEEPEEEFEALTLEDLDTFEAELPVAYQYENGSRVAAFTTLAEALDAGGDIRLTEDYDDTTPENIIISRDIQLTLNDKKVGTVTVNSGVTFELKNGDCGAVTTNGNTTLDNVKAGAITSYGNTTLKGVTTTSITVYSGSLNIPANDSGEYGVAVTATGATGIAGKVKGGKFTAIVPDLIARGYTFDYGTQKVTIKDSTVIAMIGTVAYDSVDAALAAYKSGDVILLLQNGTANFDRAGTYIFEKDGFTLTANVVEYLYIDSTVTNDDGTVTYTVKMYAARIENATNGNITYKKTFAEAVAYFNGTPASGADHIFILTNAPALTAETMATMTAERIKVRFTSNKNLVPNVTLVSGVANKAVTAESTTNDITTYKLDDIVCTIGTTPFATLQEAVAAAKPGDTIELTANVTLTEGVDVGKAITLDLNGKTITNDESITTDYLIDVLHGGDLTINDSANGGKISMGKNYCAIKMTKAGGDATKVAKLTVNGGIIEGYSFGISGNGNAGRENTEVIINGGTIRNTKTTANGDDAAIYQPQSGTLTLNGGIITGLTGVEIRSGTLIIPSNSSVQITGTGNPATYNGNGNGTTFVGAGIAVAQHTTKKAINVNIAGGEVKGANAFAVVNPENNTETNVAFAVSGGTFTGIGNNSKAIVVEDTRVSKFVSGGAFNTPVDPDYCDEGLLPAITGYENGTPVYGVTTQNYAYQLVKYPTNTDVYSGGADQGYTFAQQADAIRDAIASAALAGDAERVLVVLTATPTNVRFTAVGQKLIYAAADETEGRISFTYPDGCFGDEIVDAAHGVKSVTVTQYGAQVYEDGAVTHAYRLAELADGFAYANATKGAVIHVLQATPTDFSYTMIADKDKSLTVTYPNGAEFAPAAIKAPQGWQLHKQGNTYRVGKGIFRIDNIEAARNDYFDNLNDAAEESIKTGYWLNILGNPTDTYNLATGTTLHVVGGIDIKDKLVSGTNAIIKTTQDGADHYTTAPSVARIGKTYYNSFAAAAPVAFNSTTDKTVFLLGKLPESDHFGPLAVPGTLSVTFDEGVTPYDLTGLITVDPAFMITPDSTTVPGVTTFTVSEIAATILLGDNTKDYYDNLKDAADAAFKNANFIITPAKAGTYTFAEKDYDKTLRIATGTNIPSITVTEPDKPYFVSEDTSVAGQVSYTIGRYVASVTETKYERKTNADYTTSIVKVTSTEQNPNPVTKWYKDADYTDAVRAAEYTTPSEYDIFTMELSATPSAESVVMYKDNIRVILNDYDAKLVAPDGWTKTSTTDTESNVTTYHLTQDSYTVTFTGLGENVEDVVMTATYNQKVSDIAGKGTNPTVPDPAKTGYTRQGWVEVIDADATQAILSISNFAITKNVTVKPNWVANSYTLTLNPNGADECQAIVLPMTYGTSTDLPENTFERTGYDFAGWTTTADGDVVAYEDGATVSNLTAVNNGPVTLYAKWIPVQFTIALNINNGSNTAPDSVPVTYGTATDLPANTFTWDGHGFQGWSLTATGNAYASDASTLTAEDVAYLYSQASGDPLTVNFYAVWEEGVAQVGDTFYSFADAVRQANNQADKTIILWKDPENGDVYGFNATNLPSVINIKDMRSDVPATKTIDKLMLVNDDALYFAATDPVEGVVTYTLSKYAARLTDGTGETTYYKNFETTNGVTGAVDEFLLHSNYYNFIDILDDVEYTMTKETWEGKRLPIKETGDAVFTPKTVDDSYTIVDVDANPKDEKFIYTIETNVVVVDYFLEKYQKSKVQGEFEWVADEDFTYEDLVYPHMGTMKFESLEKAIEAIRIARGAYTGKSYQPEYIFEEAAGSVYGKRVRVNITLNASGEMALRGNEEYTITLGNNDVLVDASLDDEAVEGYAVRTSGENPVTYKACPVHGIAYGVAVDGVADQITQAELALQPQSFTTFDESLTFADLERIGYTFQGWTWRYDDGHNNGTTPAKSLVISDLSELNGNLNVLAHFTATLVAVNFLDTDGEQLSYSNNGQTLTLEPMNVAYATTLETLEGTNGYHTPEKTGYTFEGWTIQNTTAVLANNYEFKTTPVTLVPNWEIVKPTVTFVNQSKKIAENAGEADVIYTYKAYYNTTVIDIGDPLHPIDEAMHASGSEGAYSYPGYRFDKWYSDAAMTKAFDFTTTVGTEPIKVYGRFLKDSYFLTLDYKGGTDADGNTAVDPIEFTMNTAPIKLPVLKIADTEYEFEGWVAKDDDGNVVGEYTKTKGFDLSNIVVDPTNAAFQKNMTWTAVFKGKDVKLVFIDGSKILYKVTAKAGDVVNEIANLKTLVDDNTTLAKKIGDYPDGKTLVESRLWKDTTADTVVKTTDTAFHLNWLDLHEVKFFAKDVEIQTQKIADGELIKDFPIARIDGAEAFWHIGSVDGELFTKDTPVTSDLKLYATFAEKVTVTFKADAKTVIKTVEVVSGEPVAKIDDPEKKGYTFVGWFLDGAEEAFNFETAITANTTLTAKFAATNELFKDVKFAATSTLSESINLNLYMWNLPAGTDIGDYTVKVKVADNPEVENKFDKSGDKYKTIAERAYAKQMNQKVQMTVYYKDLVIKEIKDYSLRQYFENRYAATTGNEQTMFKAALDYGAAAQTYFGFETDNLANSTVNPENTFVVPVKPQSNASREGVIDDIPNYGATLIMDSEITVRFKVNPSSVDGIDFEVSEGFKKSEVSGPDASGYYYVDVTGYSPSKLGNPVTLTITKGDELVEIQYSPYAYAASKWASTFRNGSEAKLVQAMYIFGEAVKAYFHN